MEIDQIIVGQEYKVDAAGTKNHQWWTVKTIKQNKFEVWEITCTSKRASSARTFRLESFRDMKNKKEIISQSQTLVGKIGDAEMWIESVEYMPFHERRGRKPKDTE